MSIYNKEKGQYRFWFGEQSIQKHRVTKENKWKRDKKCVLAAYIHKGRCKQKVISLHKQKSFLIFYMR